MRRDSAGVVDPALNETQGDEFEAEALAALNALWQDDSERTDVIQPQHMSALVPVFGEIDPEQTTRLPDPEAKSNEDPGWDDERELTEALDFDRLAPWQAPESEQAPDWALELTTSYDRPAHDAGGELEWDEAAELTHRIDPETEAAVRAAPKPQGLDFPSYEASTARGMPSGKQAQAAAKKRERGSDPVSGFALRSGESKVQPRSAKRIGSETVPARGTRPANRALARPSSWPLPAAPVDDDSQFVPQLWQAVPAGAAKSASRNLAAELFGDAPAASSRGSQPSRVSPAARGSAGTTSRRPALRASGAGSRATRSTFPQPVRASAIAEHSQPSAAKSGPRRAVKTAVFESLAPAELERPVEPRRVPASLWWAAGGFAFVAACFAIRLATSEGPAVAPAVVSAPVEVPKLRAEDTGLSLTSNPAGAEIFVDGKATGSITPARVLNLSPGLHAVELKLAGHYATGLPALLEEGQTLGLPEVELRPLPAPSVFAAPSVAPAPVAARAPRNANRRSARRQRTASDLSAAELQVAREPEPAADGSGTGLLQINSRPWARILVDGEFMGNTPQLRLRLSAGKHSVRLVNEPLHMSKTFTVTIRDGETLTKVETLSEDAVQSGVSIQGSEALATR